jgi:hypothetical protein
MHVVMKPVKGLLVAFFGVLGPLSSGGQALIRL